MWGEKIILNLNPAIPSGKKTAGNETQIWINVSGENATGFHLKHKTGLQNTSLDLVSQDPFCVVFALKLAQVFSTNSIFFFPHSDLVSVQIWLGFWFVFLIFVACSQLFLFLWCSILSIWNEMQMCSWNCIADGIAGWSWFKKKKKKI